MWTPVSAARSTDLLFEDLFFLFMIRDALMGPYDRQSALNHFHPSHQLQLPVLYSPWARPDFVGSFHGGSQSSSPLPAHVLSIEDVSHLNLVSQPHVITSTMFGNEMLWFEHKV